MAAKNDFERFKMSPSRLEQVQARVISACQRARRSPETVKLLGVSKKQPIEKIRELYAQGLCRFAENYVSEALEKQSEMAVSNLEWHFIGRLQSNKIKTIAGHFSVIHSLSRLDHAEQLSNLQMRDPVRVILQFNSGGETTKGGMDKEGLENLFSKSVHMPGLKILGLMCMPPLEQDPERVRGDFVMTRQCLERFRSSLSSTEISKHPMNELSMGTSHDFEVAIEEGATFVRVGTDLFGPRES